MKGLLLYQKVYFIITVVEMFVHSLITETHKGVKTCNSHMLDLTDAREYSVV